MAGLVRGVRFADPSPRNFDKGTRMPMPGPNPYLPPTADDVPLVGVLADRPEAGPDTIHTWFFATDARALYLCTFEENVGFVWNEVKPIPGWVRLPVGADPPHVVDANTAD